MSLTKMAAADLCMAVWDLHAEADEDMRQHLVDAAAALHRAACAPGVCPLCDRPF